MDTTTDERPNKVKISDAGVCRKKISVEIPAETVTEQLGDSLETLLVEAALPGFRKGRAPRQLVEKRFGLQIRTEAKRQLIVDAYNRAVEDAKLKVVGNPSVEEFDHLEIEPGKPLVFEAEVEVAPEFELPSLDGVAIKKPEIPVSDEMLQHEIDRIATAEGLLEHRDSPQPGDYLTGHGVMTTPDGKEVYNIPGAVVQIPTADRKGRGMILGLLVDDFADQFGLPSPGQTATVTAVGPEHHEFESVRGASVTITFKVDRVDRIIPASVEDLVSKSGFESEQQLRDAVRTRLMQRAAVQQASVMRQQVAEYLLENTAMELPERLTASQSGRVLERERLELMYRGLEPHVVEERTAEMRAASHDQAVRELKMFFILDKIAEQNDVRVTEAEVNGRISQLALSRNMRPEALRQELIRRNEIPGIARQIREHKAMDRVLEKATITEVSVDDFNKAMEERAKTGAKKPAKKK